MITLSLISIKSMLDFEQVKFIDPYETYESLAIKIDLIGKVMAMWQTRAVKKKQKAKEMLEMAKIYKKSCSLHEFLIEIDLMQFKRVSTCMLINPFAIYAIFGQRPIDKVMSIAFPALIFAIGIVSWLTSSSIVKLICLSIQSSLMFLQIWICLQFFNARHALIEVEILEIEEMFKAKH